MFHLENAHSARLVERQSQSQLAVTPDRRNRHERPMELFR